MGCATWEVCSSGRASPQCAAARAGAPSQGSAGECLQRRGKTKVENSGICALQLAVRFLHLVEVNKRHLKYGVFWLCQLQTTKRDRELTEVMESQDSPVLLVSCQTHETSFQKTCS